MKELFYAGMLSFIMIIVSYNAMCRVLMRRNTLTRRNPYFLPPVYIQFLKAAVKEKSIAILWFFVHVLSFLICYMIVDRGMR
jgi:hypothetical protein